MKQQERMPRYSSWQEDSITQGNLGTTKFCILNAKPHRLGPITAATGRNLLHGSAGLHRYRSLDKKFFTSYEVSREKFCETDGAQQN